MFVVLGVYDSRPSLNFLLLPDRRTSLPLSPHSEGGPPVLEGRDSSSENVFLNHSFLLLALIDIKNFNLFSFLFVEILRVTTNTPPCIVRYPLGSLFHSASDCQTCPRHP